MFGMQRVPEVSVGESFMRLKLSIIASVVVLVVGVVLLKSQSLVDWWWPAFTAHEVVNKVGRSVSYRHTNEFNGYKCRADGPCKKVADGERGVVIGLEQVGARAYFLVVWWDEPADSENYLSYFGRYSGREALAE
jgi:hypothetical protein